MPEVAQTNKACPLCRRPLRGRQGKRGAFLACSGWAASPKCGYTADTSVAGPEAVYRYLGRYTHRVGLSNHRLISATDEPITFRTRGEETASPHPHEFLRRFLMHVLPRGFVKLRHYGLLAPGNVNTKLVAALGLLMTALAAATPPNPALQSTLTPIATETSADWRELLHRLTGLDLSRCQKCGGAIFSRALEHGPPKDTS